MFSNSVKYSALPYLYFSINGPFLKNNDNIFVDLVTNVAQPHGANFLALYFLYLGKYWTNNVFCSAQKLEELMNTIVVKIVWLGLFIFCQ